MPVDALEQQIRIYQINKNAIQIDDVLTLMEIFAVPYKAMVLRLMEEQILSAAIAEKMIEVPFSEIRQRMRITGKAKRWDMVQAGYAQLGSLLENLTINSENEFLPKSRLESDWTKLEEIKTKYGIE